MLDPQWDCLWKELIVLSFLSVINTSVLSQRGKRYTKILKGIFKKKRYRAELVGLSLEFKVYINFHLTEAKRLFFLKPHNFRQKKNHSFPKDYYLKQA